MHVDDGKLRYTLNKGKKKLGCNYEQRNLKSLLTENNYFIQHVVKTQYIISGMYSVPFLPHDGRD